MGTARRLTPLTLPPKITERVILRQKSGDTPETRMPQEPNTPNALEQLVSRSLRDNLDRVQRISGELQQAVADVIAACGSSKPTNALPFMLRAQTASASLSAVLEVLSRFVAITGTRSPFDAEIARLAGGLTISREPAVARVAAHEPPAPAPASRVAEPKVAAAPAPPAVERHPVAAQEHHAAEGLDVEVPPPAPGEPEYDAEFSVSRLSAEEQELHRRANRVAKVSMQDIKMLRPEQVRLGREHKDICIRLRDDIEKAHREYDRRFKPIMDHPVDYFYRWMVEILAEGDPHALGEYPYATTGTRH
jgi:hypothetical protein